MSHLPSLKECESPLFDATNRGPIKRPFKANANIIRPGDPVDANEFIIAIAAQERRVLELREELLRAESELSTLKKKWSSKEVYSRRHESRHSETSRPTTTAPLEVDTGSARQSVDLDRRRLLLQQPNTPTQKGRRVLRGGHARTLSLLSPPKSYPDFAILEDRNYEPVSLPLPPIERRAAQLTNPNLAKRASWQPQSHRQQSNVPGLVEDFRMGLKAFVEDIRQITVGEEPISGSPANAAGQQRPSMTTSQSSGDLETIRSSQPARPKVSSTFDIPIATAASTPSTQKANDGTCQDKPKAGRNKRFSWTPLSFDSVDDSSWSNWDSPASAKSTRWSGSTINSGGAEDIESIPEASEEVETPSKPKSTPEDAPLLSPKLGEILPSMVNKFTPSNIKRTANHIMDEWEKSLIEPQTANDKENSF
ncbi:uncharacterized protein J7T54_002164 [Emericellopsis cladophorae]|uniref:DUF4048 domain-containing protein n=1 Tax=Emericellopsis cladophorae TaxID=2686198 RepID=A0A9P9Y4F7_9HYPO|nr:uncharacterized protein J7T54_002164 [Emericellopsis cladophorae]KAI6783003.1 hypothetical protein J7T54_002164 [Emericellopsis cladophorae]